MIFKGIFIGMSVTFFGVFIYRVLKSSTRKEARDQIRRKQREKIVVTLFYSFCLRELYLQYVTKTYEEVMVVQELLITLQEIGEIMNGKATYDNRYFHIVINNSKQLTVEEKSMLDPGHSSEHWERQAIDIISKYQYRGEWLI
ncbi:hypothetical protein ACQWO4_002877 [Listeria monocytogenes]